MSKRLNMLFAGVVLAVASGTAAAHSGVTFGISLGLPVVPVYAAPPAVVYYEPARVYYAPAPRVYYERTYYGRPAIMIRRDRHFRTDHYRGHWR